MLNNNVFFRLFHIIPSYNSETANYSTMKNLCRAIIKILIQPQMKHFTSANRIVLVKNFLLLSSFIDFLPKINSE